MNTQPIETQMQSPNQLKTRLINPWAWQNERGYVQAVEVKQPNATLYISGQAAIDADGISSTADMRSQIVQAIQNLELVISEAGYVPASIVRLNIYTTSVAELIANFDVMGEWVAKHGLKQATTVLEVNALFETCTVELEATAVQ